MKFTQSFSKTSKDVPSDEQSKNAQLLIRAGYIHKEMAGVYSLLPLGFKVLNNIKRITNEEMLKLNSQELIMSSLQNKETWEKTDRWSDEKVDIWFKTKLRNDTEIGLGWSHEEPIVNMMKSHINSYKNLPVIVHQFQNKLRNETRAKAGVMRCREFIMKDMYSFFVDEKSHMDFYNKTIESYMNVYKRLGLGNITYVTSASGGVFTDKFSHEFQTVCEAGEDIIYIHKKENYAINEEVFNDDTLKKMNAKKEDFEKKVAAEVGNIFTFGTEKCEKMDLYFKNEKDEKIPVYLGSYGIGVTRLMGVLTEVMSDEGGLVWPNEVAPYALHLVSLHKEEGDEVHNYAKDIYEKLIKNNVEVIWDDRTGHGTGEKLGDADLIGIPMRVLVSAKTILEDSVEIKERRAKKEESEVMKTEVFLKSYTEVC
jgi:prolyl-tRNA synthetase